MGHENVKGMLLPLPTPFDGDGGLDEGLLAEMAAYYVDRGVDSLFLFGSYGQGPAMSVEQRKRGLESIMKRVHGKIPIVVHIGAVDPYTSKELGLHARAEGASGWGVGRAVTISPSCKPVPLQHKIQCAPLFSSP